MTAASPSLEYARSMAEAALDLKAQDVILLEVTGLTSFADAFVICTGTSDRHVRAVADAVVQRSKALGESPLGVEGYEDGHWVLIDLNDVLVHVFLSESRTHYDLERLWEDAPVTLFGQPEGGTPGQPEGEPPARRQVP